MVILMIMEEDELKQSSLFTRNFLVNVEENTSASDVIGSCEGSGDELRVDLMSGKTYLDAKIANQARLGLQCLDLFPSKVSSTASSSTLMDESALLDLKLFSGVSAEYQSVCTMEKVRSALEKAGRAPSGDEHRCKAESASSSASPSSSATSSSIKRMARVAEGDDGGSDPTGEMIAAACPGCLLYVLISKANPRCPRCVSHVPVPAFPKKAKLN